jgi:hypothetical protein
MEAEIPENERDSAQFTVDCVEMPLPDALVSTPVKAFQNLSVSQKRQTPGLASWAGKVIV